MNDRFAAALSLLPELLAAHVALSAAAMALGLILGLPLAVFAATSGRVRWLALSGASLVQTIPALALLALFYPLLLGVSALLAPLGGSVPALGFLPALMALALYALLPILRNGVAGLCGVDPAVREAADGVGMTAFQRLLLVEAPLAAPVVMAGVRTAATWTIGAATLSTTVGAPSLGNLVFAGLQTEDWLRVLVGCAASAALALAADQLLGLIEAGAARRSRLRIGVGLAGLALGLAAALLWPAAGGARAPGPARETITIGAKNFSEQYILAELIARRLRAAGYAVELRSGLGSAVAFRALSGGDIDVYVDYSGTLWANVLGRADMPERAAMLAATARLLRERHGVRLLGPLGFENAYALAMRRERAAGLGARSIADLARAAPALRLAADLEFLSRPEWRRLRDTYRLRFASAEPYSPTFMYRALTGGRADVISAFSSDGRIAALDLVTLADPARAIPSYDAVLLLAPARADDGRLARALAPLIGRIPVDRMRQANLMVDRDVDKRSPREAAAWLEHAAGVGRPVQPPA